MKFSALAIATFTTLAAAYLIPEERKQDLIYSPVGAPHHPEHRDPGLGDYGEGKGKHPEVLPSADGDNFKVIKIYPDQSQNPNPAPIHLKHDSRPYKYDHKGDHKHDHKPRCPYEKHHPKHEPKHDREPCPYHKHEHKHENKPCPYQKHEHEHKPDHKPCPYHKHEHKHDHKPCPSEKHDHKPEYHKPEPPKPEQPKPEQPKPQDQPKLEGECSPGTYACTFNPKSGAPGWKVCNASGKWEFGGDCPPNTVCKFYTPNKSPYCVPRYYEFP
ncbi:unnamed protein product [Clonostachys solani]|uniref:Uncharacterized protein n=1 Tax=Clonostachys solani TaxID=160281 RepID=A0A9N9W2D6_9HYPO|nr:unnamed protein product [Clonostachys solani]